jgi:hypothetical protein
MLFIELTEISGMEPERQSINMNLVKRILPEYSIPGHNSLSSCLKLLEKDEIYVKETPEEIEIKINRKIQGLKLL